MKNRSTWAGYFKGTSCVAIAVCAFSGGLVADTINSASGTFSAFPNGFSAATPSFASAVALSATPSMAFWNNCSYDSIGGNHEMNVGDLLSDSGGFAGTPSILGTDTPVQYLSAAGGAAPSAFNFVRNANAYDITLLFADSSLDTGNASIGTVFGTYSGGVFTPIYTAGATNTPTGTQGFHPTTPGNSYGFYATVCYAIGRCETYTTGDGNWGNEGGGSGWNHFALFQLTSGNYVVGFEDANGIFAENGGDYNDVVIELSNVAVPEPSTLVLVGLCLCTLARLGRHRKR